MLWPHVDGPGHIAELRLGVPVEGEEVAWLDEHGSDWTQEWLDEGASVLVTRVETEAGTVTVARCGRSAPARARAAGRGAGRPARRPLRPAPRRQRDHEGWVRRPRRPGARLPPPRRGPGRRARRPRRERRGRDGRRTGRRRRPRRAAAGAPRRPTRLAPPRRRRARRHASRGARARYGTRRGTGRRRRPESRGGRGRARRRANAARLRSRARTARPALRARPRPADRPRDGRDRRRAGDGRALHRVRGLRLRLAARPRVRRSRAPRGGTHEPAAGALRWLEHVQTPEGLWLHRHWTTGELAPSWGLHQLDETGAVLFAAEAVWEELRDVVLDRELWASVRRGADALVGFLDRRRASRGRASTSGSSRTANTRTRLRPSSGGCAPPRARPGATGTRSGRSRTARLPIGSPWRSTTCCGTPPGGATCGR